MKYIIINPPKNLKESEETFVFSKDNLCLIEDRLDKFYWAEEEFMITIWNCRSFLDNLSEIEINRLKQIIKKYYKKLSFIDIKTNQTAVVTIFNKHLDKKEVKQKILDNYIIKFKLISIFEHGTNLFFNSQSITTFEILELLKRKTLLTREPHLNKDTIHYIFLNESSLNNKEKQEIKNLQEKAKKYFINIFLIKNSKGIFQDKIKDFFALSLFFNEEKPNFLSFGNQILNHQLLRKCKIKKIIIKINKHYQNNISENDGTLEINLNFFVGPYMLEDFDKDIPRILLIEDPSIILEDYMFDYNSLLLKNIFIIDKRKNFEKYDYFIGESSKYNRNKFILKEEDYLSCLEPLLTEEDFKLLKNDFKIFKDFLRENKISFVNIEDSILDLVQSLKDYSLVQTFLYLCNYSPKNNYEKLKEEHFKYLPYNNLWENEKLFREQVVKKLKFSQYDHLFQITNVKLNFIDEQLLKNEFFQLVFKTELKLQFEINNRKSIILVEEKYLNSPLFQESELATILTLSQGLEELEFSEEVEILL